MSTWWWHNRKWRVHQSSGSRCILWWPCMSLKKGKNSFSWWLWKHFSLEKADNIAVIAFFQPSCEETRLSFWTSGINMFCYFLSPYKQIVLKFKHKLLCVTQWTRNPDRWPLWPTCGLLMVRRMRGGSLQILELSHCLETLSPDFMQV